MVRRIARLCVGLTAHDKMLTLPVGHWVVGSQVDSVLVTTTDPRLKLSVLLDLALDSDLARSPQAKVLEVHTLCVELRGAKSFPALSLKRTTTGFAVIT